ncbi:MAG TPA: tetratricopeptide repeat protein [Vicinamibacterales bacterium]|nr:tetratricopeptide repeat protein [Vicinamibacterales bacterium]
MRETRDRHLGPWLRPLAAVAILCVCATTAGSTFAPGSQASAGPEPFIRAATRALAHGRPAEAEALARGRPAGDPDAAAVLARLAVRRGEYAEAGRLLEPAAKSDPEGEAALELGLHYQRQGRGDEAAQVLSRVFRQGGADPEALFRAARAAHALGRARDANALYRAASSGGSNPAVETAWGTLFLESRSKDGLPEALRSFRQAIEADARWAPAHAGVARTLVEEDPPAAAAAAARALEIDRDLAEAHLLLAGLELDNTRYDSAREQIEGVLAVNPNHLDARALLGAMAYVRDDRTAFEAEVSRMFEVNPAFGEAYRVAADLSARHYRFDEAVALTRKAIAVDPSNARAFADLGMHLMRTGDEAEARRALDRAFKDNPFDVVTFNLLGLLDTLDKFEVIRDGDIVMKLHPEDAPVLREYALPLAHQALEQLSAAYEFRPTGPILIEIFQQHDDFAVRNLGLPGLKGALGACFGRVVSMDSPRARPPGTFSWQATLWHELAHVITLQMSSQRVPRWLTEGVSVHEEGRARAVWGRDMEVPFAIALERGQVLKLRDLNSGFTKPDTIALAYYQASLLVDHIVKTHGAAALRALLRTYGEGVEGDAAIAKGLGVSIDQLQASFDKSLDARFASLRAALREQDKGGSDDLESLRATAAARPHSYRAQLALGAALASQGDKAAFMPLEKAAALVPMATGENSPNALMGRLAEELGDAPRALRAYEALLAHDHAAIEPARRLAALAAKAGNTDALALAYDRIVEIDPFDADGHTGLGRLALERKDAATATREFIVALAIGPPDRAAAHCDLGESHLLAGRRAEAKRQALAALEIAPSYERAQELLLKSLDAKEGSTGAPTGALPGAGR